MKLSDIAIYNRIAKKLVPTADLGGAPVRSVTTRSVPYGTSVDYVAAEYIALFAGRVALYVDFAGVPHTYSITVSVTKNGTTTTETKTVNPAGTTKRVDIGQIDVVSGDVLSVRISHTNNYGGSGQFNTIKTVLGGYVIDNPQLYAVSEFLEV